MPENNRPLLSELFTFGGFDPRTGINFDGVKKKPDMGVALGGQPKRGGGDGQWITIGGQPDSSTGEKHVGGFRVFIDPNGNILKGRMRGKNVKDVKNAFDKKKEKASGGQQGRNVRGTGASPFRRHESVGNPVANTPTGPGNTTPGQRRQGKNKPVGPEAAGDAPIERVNRRIDRFTNLFQTKGQTQAVEWLKEFKEQINTLGADQALAALGEAKTNLSAPKNVQYEGAYDEIAEVKSEVDFIEGYLKRAGISLVQTGSTLDPNAPVISSFSAKNLKALERTVPEAPGNYVPTDQTFENKLEESKHLPGLESSEDIDKIVGSKVTAFTPEVIAKLDARYGKGKWIVKSYGAEAYAGFGVFFPQKVAQIQRDAKAVIAEAKKGLKENGFALFRGEDNKITGVTNGKQVFGFGTEEYNKLNKKIKGLVKQVSQAAPSEAGARLPMSPEQELKEGYFGISLMRNVDGIPIGVTDREGKNYPFGSDSFKKLEETDGGSTGYAIHRAVETDEWRRQGFQADAKFMAQPAFEAVGVKDADRALGLTWETAKEGRVHVTTRGGKAAAIPYATLVGRGDDLPATFASEDSKAMEKAVEDAINQLPESERTGQLYAPDVVKTKDGWKVIELNPSAEGGGSDWLGRNPFVIDALVSHMTGREPMHVQFIRRLLATKGIKAAKPPTQTPPTEGTALAFIEEQHPRKRKGQEGGGQFVKGGSTGAVRTVKLGNIKARYSLHTDTRIKGPSIPLKNYKQQDYHTCGFVAALTLTRYLKSDVTPKEVLKVIRPTMSSGIDGKRMKRSLKELGIEATYRKDLTVGMLRKYVAKGTPVLLTVYPEDWSSDHWVIVQGFDGNKIYLTNYKSLPVNVFASQWFDRGEGLVCKPIEGKKGTALSTDAEGHEHKGKGEGGGQFTSKGDSGSDTANKSKETKNTKPRTTSASVALHKEVEEYKKLGISPADANSGDCHTVAREAIKTIRDAGGKAEFAVPNVGPAHIWVLYNGRHYDIQHPDGVDNPAELSFFDDNPDILEEGWKSSHDDPLSRKTTEDKPLAISDAESPEVDTPPTLVSDTEILPAIGAFPTEQNKPVTVDDLPRKIQVTTDWGRLRAVVVGRLDNDVLPAWYPSFDNPDGNEVDGPETMGQTKEEYDPKMFRKAVKQTEALCDILEKEGVKVFRPNLISPADAQADPIGLTSEWAREMFTVVGNKVIVNQPRAAHRNKDRDALTPMLLEIERAGKAQIVYPPTTDWQRREDDLENDPRPFIEGGDVFRFGNDVLVTMSHLATSPAGYRWLADELEPDGISVWPAYLKPEWEHGDYVFFPVREGLCIAYLKGFKDGMLPVPCQDWQVIEITHDEANNGFAANGLVLRENVMLLPKGLPRVRRALEKKGVEVIEVPFDGPMFWQGAIDCATSELWRDG